MEEKDFPENSNSEIIDTGPPVSNTGDPPNITTLDKGSPPDPPDKGRINIGRKVLALALSFVMFLSVIGGLVVLADTLGSSSGQKSPTFKAGGNCTGEVVYYPLYMITPMKLFNYYSEYAGGEQGTQILSEGQTQKGKGVSYGDGQEYKLKENQYYGGTVKGFDSGSLFMVSNAVQDYRGPSGKLGFASALDRGDVTGVKLKGDGSLGGDKTVSGHIVYFNEDGTLDKDVSVGEKDPDPGLSGFSPDKHVFTKMLYQKTNSYDFSKLQDKLLGSAHNEMSKSELEKLVKGRKKDCLKLWEAISCVDNSSLKIDPSAKINKYISPNNSDPLFSNLNKGDEKFSDVNKKKQQLVLYHELDLLLTLYTISSNSTDAKCEATWRAVVNGFLKGWDDPSQMTSKSDLENAMSYSTLAVSPALALLVKGDYYIVAASDYAEYTLGVREAYSTREPRSANLYWDKVDRDSDPRKYIFNLYSKALAKSSVKTSSAWQLRGKSGLLGSMNLFYNVLGRKMDLSDSGSGSTLKISLTADTHKYYSAFAYLQLKERVWGSNLIFLNTNEGGSKFELPQFSVDLSIENDNGKGEYSICLAGIMNDITKINERPQLNFSISSNIKKNQDDYFQKLVDDGKRKVRNEKDNINVLKSFMKDKATKDMSIS